MSAPGPMESARGMSPRPGLRVITRDGHELGHVKEASGQAFKVDAPLVHDYWLSNTFILAMGAQDVEMDFDEEVLDDYKLEGPGVASESPILDAEADVFENQAAKRATRERMEHGAPPHE